MRAFCSHLLSPSQFSNSEAMCHGYPPVLGNRSLSSAMALTNPLASLIQRVHLSGSHARHPLSYADLLRMQFSLTLMLGMAFSGTQSLILAYNLSACNADPFSFQADSWQHGSLCCFTAASPDLIAAFFLPSPLTMLAIHACVPSVAVQRPTAALDDYQTWRLLSCRAPIGRTAHQHLEAETPLA